MLAIAIFALVYLIILAGENSPRKLDRPSAGLVGGVLMVLCGVLTRRQAMASIDFSTLALLFGVMVVIHYAAVAGLLDSLAYRLVSGAHSPRQLLWIVSICAGTLSALFVNDTVCLLMTPLVITTVRRAALPAEPYLLGLATSSNVGSVMTLTGNPQNMLIGQSSHWTWAAFAIRMVPIGIVCLVINTLVVQRSYRGQLRSEAHLNNANALGEKPALDRLLAVKTGVVLVGLLIAFLAGAPMDTAALCAAVTILILAGRPPKEAFDAVDWSLLLFFAGLFVVVDGVTRAESDWIARSIPTITSHPGSLAELSTFSASSVVGSNLFSNVPFVMLIRGWVAPLPQAPLLWLMLAAASTFAGNLTLVGSVANLIVAQRAGEGCRLSFRSFLRIGPASTLLTVIASVFFVWLYSLFHWV